jgi:hypothetical protein
MAEIESSEQGSNGRRMNPFQEIEQAFMNIHNVMTEFNVGLQSIAADSKLMAQSETELCNTVVDFCQSMATAIHRLATAVRRLSTLAEIVLCFATFLLGVVLTLVMSFH